MLRRAVLTALLVAASLFALPNAAHAELRWGGCVDFDGFRCATLSVPLDRTGVDPGTINLRVGRVGRNSGKTLMYLSGGPGGAGFSEMLSVMPSFPYLVENYRLIGYDQRGTGRSGLLRCPRLEKDPQLRDTAAAAECAEQIGIARRHYTTPDSVQDIEAIRAELGVEQLTLFGISYGTELALAYARAYPQHVERLILDSVVDYDDPDPFFTAGLRAMGPSLKSVCPLRCRYLTPDPGAELAQLVAKLHTQPMQALTYDERGRSQRLNITPVALFDLMFLTDYLPSLRAVVPIAVHAALGRRRRAAGARPARVQALRRDRLPARLLGRPLRDDVRDEPGAVGRGNAARSAPGERPAAPRGAPSGRLRALRRDGGDRG